MDEDLRAADRRLSFATPEERVRHARHLERSGRPDEALAVLLAATESPLVRRELARWPSWTSENANGTRFLDAPIFENPRVAWSIRVPIASGVTLVASAHGVLHAAGTRTLLVDPTTGAVRAELSSGYLAAISGERVLLSDLHAPVEVFDLLTGERTGALAGTTGCWSIAPGRDGLAFLTAEEGLQAWDVRGEPRLLWERPTPADHCFADEELVIAWQRDRIFAFDARTGAPLWEARGFAIALDEHGVLARTIPGGPLVLYDRAGRQVWADEYRRWHALALGPEVLALSVIDDPAVLTVHDRRTMTPRSQRPVTFSPIALVRDTLLHWPERGALAASTLDGGELWRVDVGADLAHGELALAPGRIYAGNGNTLVAIATGPA